MNKPCCPLGCCDGKKCTPCKGCDCCCCCCCKVYEEDKKSDCSKGCPCASQSEV